VPDRPIVLIGPVPSSPQTLDVQGDPDTIPGQSGSAGEQPNRTKGRAVFSIWNCGPFAFSVPFVLKTHPNVGNPVAQLRFNRMNENSRKSSYGKLLPVGGFVGRRLHGS